MSPQTDPPPQPNLRDAVQAGVARDNVWLFALNKSGTTFLCHTLAFAYARVLGRRDVTFDSIASAGVLRWSRGVDVERYVASALAFRSQTSLPLIVVTAHDIGAAYRRAVLLTRDPYDFCVSYYHYRYAHRESRSGVTLDRALPEIVATWATTEIAQRRLLEADPERVRRVRYASLISDPERTIGGVVRFIDAKVPEGDLRVAIAEAGRDRLREHELRTGRAAVAGDDYTARHFARSGRVGEGREVLSPAQLRRIGEELGRHGLAPPSYDADAD